MVEFELKFDPKMAENYRKKVDLSQQKVVDKKLQTLKLNPKRGNQLFAIYPNLYELYAGSYRIYYVLQEKEIRVVVIAYSHKDEQEKWLNAIKNNHSIIDNILKEIP